MKIKIAILVCVFAFSSQINAQESAKNIMDNAFAQAKQENKNVFLIFHASWCGWCKKMDKQMQSETLKPIFTKNYVTAHLTVQESKENKNLENPGAMDIMEKYNGDKAGLPFWLIFNNEGKLVANSFNDNGENLGCPASPEEVDSFIKKLKITSKMNDIQLAAVKEIFVIKE